MSEDRIPAWLTRTTVPIAWCWRIERRDGVVIGLTTHDRALVRDGLVYRPAPGIRPSAIRQTRGLSGDSMEVEGALSADTLTGADLLAGRWDGAALTLSVVDWQDGAAPPVLIARGALGAVTSDGRGFTAELGSADPRLREPCVPSTSPGCRAALGDHRCGVSLARYRRRARVVALGANGVTVADDLMPDAFVFGQLRWLGGPQRGLRAGIVGQQDRVLTIDTLGEGAVAGVAVELTEGCDGRPETCAARFANIVNFRGEPHLPGIDLLTRYPGG